MTGPILMILGASIILCTLWARLRVKPSGRLAVIHPQDTNRVGSVSWAVAKITFALTIVMVAGWLAYRWGHSGPDRFDTLGWALAFGGWWLLPLLLPLLCVPAIFAYTITGVVGSIWLDWKRQIPPSSDQD